MFAPAGKASRGAVTSQSGVVVPNATVARPNAVFTHIGVGGFGTLSLQNGGKSFYNGTGIVTLLNLYGTIDFSGGGGAVTITNANLYKGATIKDPLGRVTWTNKPVPVGCSLSDINVDLGQGRMF